MPTNPFDRQCTVGRHDHFANREVLYSNVAAGRLNKRSSSETLGTVATARPGTMTTARPGIVATARPGTVAAARPGAGFVWPRQARRTAVGVALREPAHCVRACA